MDYQFFNPALVRLQLEEGIAALEQRDYELRQIPEPQFTRDGIEDQLDRNESEHSALLQKLSVMAPPESLEKQIYDQVAAEVEAGALRKKALLAIDEKIKNYPGADSDPDVALAVLYELRNGAVEVPEPTLGERVVDFFRPTV
jgi:hypothetical protein